MKMNTMSIALAAALLSMSAANASEFKGAYVGANIGYNKNTPTSATTSNKAYPGLQAGYNWDVSNNIVLGLEGFVDGHSKSITSNDAGIDAKAGYSMGNLMPYARLGAAATQPGTRVHGGLGLEYKFAPQWSMFGEVTADRKSVNNVSQKNTNFALGVNYYFDKPAVAAAVVAVAAPIIMKKAEPVAAPATVVAAPATVVAAPAQVVVATAPVAAPAPVAPAKVFTLKGTNFATNSAKLMPAASQQMSEVLDFAAHNADGLKIVGHTDSRGKESANEKLSAARAESVKAYLVKHGVDAKRITTAGKASTQPVGDNKTEAGRAANRRVEVTAVPVAK
jgi:outer membrane protein OmpA-like peptidoglycan-associated protein